MFRYPYGISGVSQGGSGESVGCLIPDLFNKNIIYKIGFGRVTGSSIEFWLTGYSTVQVGDHTGVLSRSDDSYSSVGSKSLYGSSNEMTFKAKSNGTGFQFSYSQVRFTGESLKDVKFTEHQSGSVSEITARDINYKYRFCTYLNGEGY